MLVEAAQREGGERVWWRPPNGAGMKRRISTLYVLEGWRASCVAPGDSVSHGLPRDSTDVLTACGCPRAL